MAIILKKTAYFLLGILLFLFVMIGGLLLYANTDTGKAHISKIATDMLDRQVRLGGGIGLRGTWPPTLYVSDLEVENYEGGQAEKMVDIGLLEVSISPGRLLLGDLVLPKIILRDSDIALERNTEGDANWSLGKEQPERGNQEPADLPLIGALEITNSRVRYVDAVQKIDIALEATTEGENVLVKGKGNYQGHPFVVNALGGSLLTVQEDKPYPVDTHLTIGHTEIIAKGSVQDPMHFAGMDINLTVKGANAADLFPIFGIALPPTSPYQVTGRLGYNDAVWTFNDIKGTMGNSDISGDVEWNPTFERPKLTAAFVSQKLDFDDLGPLIGVAPEQAVSEEQKATAAKQEASPRAIPDVPLDISRIAAMDADVSLTGKSILAPGWPLDDFFLHVILEDRILRIDPVKFGTAKGDVAATLHVNARENPPQTEADFRFRRLSLAELMRGISDNVKSITPSEGYIGGAAKLKGQGVSLHQMLANSNGTVGIGMRGGMLSNLLVELAGLDVAQALGFFLAGDKPVPINCALGHFEVKDGVMHSKALLIDTDDTNIKGEGTIDLEDEKMDLRFVPRPKDVSLVALRSPITVGGTMKSPAIGIEPQNLAARGGAAAVLGIALTPVAAILAFIDPATGDDSPCKAMIDRANKQIKANNENSLIPQNENRSKAATTPAKTDTTQKATPSTEEVNPKSETLPPAAKRDVKLPTATDSAGRD